MNQIILSLEKKLKIKIKNKSLISQALQHKSFHATINNERYEFLGDRVIGLILSKKLLELYPDENEGVLDKKFAKLVNKKTCASISWAIGLKDFILLGNQQKSLKQTDEKILSDACEALIGAIYLDKGFKYTELLVLRLWKNELLNSNITIIDSKTKLQEYSLKKFKKLPIYKTEKVLGSDHNPIFKISVQITGSKKVLASSNSKKNAEQKAAKILLNSMKIV